MKSGLGSFHAENVGQDLVCEEPLEQACGSWLVTYKEAQVRDLPGLLEPNFCDFRRHMDRGSSRMLP